MKLAVSALLIGSAAAFSSPSMTFSVGKKGAKKAAPKVAPKAAKVSKVAPKKVAVKAAPKKVRGG